MLHSFWYEKARDTFAGVAEKDPTCGMAYWGITMTYYHPIWRPPSSADPKAGGTFIAGQAGNDLERGLVFTQKRSRKEVPAPGKTFACTTCATM